MRCVWLREACDQRVASSDGFETKPVYYEVVHGATLRVRVFTGVTSDSRAHLECIVTYYGDPEAPELRT